MSPVPDGITAVHISLLILEPLTGVWFCDDHLALLPLVIQGSGGLPGLLALCCTKRCQASGLYIVKPYRACSSGG